MEFFRIKKDIPFMRHALVFNIISLITFILAVVFLALMEGSFYLGAFLVGKQLLSRYWRSMVQRFRR